MFLQDVSPSLCKGPPLARAYNYVKFIERGGGEGGKRGGRGTFWLKQDPSKMGMSNLTPQFWLDHPKRYPSLDKNNIYLRWDLNVPFD